MRVTTSRLAAVSIPFTLPVEEGIHRFRRFSQNSPAAVSICENLRNLWTPFHARNDAVPLSCYQPPDSLCAARTGNRSKEAAEETRMKHGQTDLLQDPCRIRVQNVAKFW